MTREEAETLAADIQRSHPAAVTVVQDSECFVVQVESAAGRWTLYDEEDWQAWRPRISSKERERE